MKPIKGENLMLFIDGTSIAFATSHTLEISLDTREISTKDNGGKWSEVEAGIISWTMSSENLVGNPGRGKGYDDLVDAMIARKPVDVVFALEGSSKDFESGKLDAAPTAGWIPKESVGRSGQALITSVSLNAPNGEYATMSISLTGIGALKSEGNITTTETAQAKTMSASQTAAQTAKA